ncbi:ABC transporter permease [Pseudooceanicola nanhaiensis]|uniref:ABC transporter permease n=1 Tax=Pseudooceanicola nanhaiensis TaxID=375761 RepID=UPI001CD64427|nr:ABC transporter permease [Pseudooceanicola nanhaiensis]MCA0922159.1 ABC transporter permease [Pseudooceanicola nanhaiensis]
MSDQTSPAAPRSVLAPLRAVPAFVAENIWLSIGIFLLGGLALLSFGAPLFTAFDPVALNVTQRLKPATEGQPFGTDLMGRDVFARVLYGGRISLTVGLTVAFVASLVGLIVGIAAGLIRWVDVVVMRVMDGLMAIPSVLLAIAFMALAGSSIRNIVIAITIPEVPRVARLVRGIVMSVREQPFVEAAVAAGTPDKALVLRHILPSTLTPLVVQATYICASAIISEAYLSFLGAGTPPEIPSWGNVVAEGRSMFLVNPGLVLYPSLFLAATVLAVNIVGDGLRDRLDPQMTKALR